MDKQLGQYLKEKREQKRLTLRQVEEETGIQNGYLSQLENGKIARPSPGNLHKLAGAYGVPYGMLLEMAGYPAMEQENNFVKSLISHEFNNLSNEEEEKLKEYLQFLRSTKKQG